MKCPKCGGEIPFYDLKPNCRHCGVNILYYTQDYLLERDAKRTELESAVARMVVARIKAVYVGSLLAVLRMIGVIGAICVLMIPMCTVQFNLPFYKEEFSVGLIGLVNGVMNGLFFALPDYKDSTLFSQGANYAIIISVWFALILLIDIAVFAVWLLAAISPNKTAKVMKHLSLAAAGISLIAQITALLFSRSFEKSPFMLYALGFGAMASFAVHIVLYFINAKMLKKGIEPQYREFDPKRKELLKKVRSGEVSLDDLPLPVFESEKEREERMKILGEALDAEAAYSAGHGKGADAK